jgi:GT2 family glycosyltransferase
MSKLSDVTIIIPIFVTTLETLDWLGECLDSAYAQKCNVVVYDDGSTVDLQQLLGIYIQDYKYVPVKNRGVSYARNKAIEAVDTELILPLDCDDRFKPNTVTEMLAYWDIHHVPVYSDVAKFGDINIPHYPLFDFACEHILKHVGFTAVSVLHSKAMWKQIGGYDESIEFYEDGEYNARLLGTYCGVRCPKPLVEYRIHAKQRTKTYEKQSAYYAKLITEKVRNYEMACPGCSGKRRTNSLNSRNTGGQVMQSTQSLNAPQKPSEMPKMDDKGYVLVQYVGGRGRGTHWYNGLVTGNAYRVIEGLYLHVDKNDAREANDTHSHSFFVRVIQPEPVVKTAVPVVRTPIVEKVVVPTVRAAVSTSIARTPVWEAPVIAKMRLVDIQNLELTPAQAAKLLEEEQNGRNRIKVVDWLTLKADEK